MSVVPSLAATAVPSASVPADAAPGDYAAGALVRALHERGRRGADVDGALALFVRRARVDDEPVERMLARLKALLLAHVRPLRADDDPREVVALVMRRAITEFYR